MWKSSLVVPQVFLFFFNHMLQFGADQRVSAKRLFIQNHYPAFGQSAHGKFTVQRVPNLSHDQHVQRSI